MGLRISIKVNGSLLIKVVELTVRIKTFPNQRDFKDTPIHPPKSR